MALIIFLHENVAIKKFNLDQNGLRFGRSVECEVSIEDKLVSKEHAMVEVVEAPKHTGQYEYFINDLNSTNQTFLNGTPVTRQKLANNDVIRIGRHTFKFIDELDSETEKTLKLHKSWIPGVYYTKDEE
jgi:pSer/pThr/pTyr-binding forkhead associated (FHA) protein